LIFSIFVFFSRYQHCLYQEHRDIEKKRDRRTRRTRATAADAQRTLGRGADAQRIPAAAPTATLLHAIPKRR
jgi:hypothetical protein